jgi:Ser/Thr protein kinase RdoA (MazF antagonist)
MSHKFPVTFTILSTDALVRRVLPEYGICDVVSCQLHSVNVNHTYEVHTRSGEAYFLRVYRHNYRNLEEVRFEMDALVHLHQRGASVAYPLPLKEGDFIQAINAPEGERYTVLFPAAAGKEPNYNDDVVRKAFEYGRAVAQLHRAADGFYSDQPRFKLDLTTLIDTPLQHIAPVLAYRPDDWAYTQDFAARTKEKIIQMPVDALEQGLCHGDLQGYHHHVDKTGQHTFFDFDFCGIGFRAYDLSVFRWCGRLSDKELVWWEPYLRGYLSERPLTPVDIKAVPLFICARHIWHMGLHTGNAKDWGYGDLKDSYFDWRMARLHELDKDYLGGNL